MSNVPSTYAFETLKCSAPSPGNSLYSSPGDSAQLPACAAGVLHVELNRPKALNAMNHQFWLECRQCFYRADADPEVSGTSVIDPPSASHSHQHPPRASMARL